MTAGSTEGFSETSMMVQLILVFGFIVRADTRSLSDYGIVCECWLPDVAEVQSLGEHVVTTA